MITDPTIYGIPKRTILKEIDSYHLAIIKDIKSRIISKDAKRIKEMADLIASIEPNLKISLCCNRNICSKSIAYLTENNIDIIYLHD